MSKQQEPAPIIQNNRRRIAQNTCFDIYFDEITDPGGETVNDYLVVSPRKRIEQEITGVAVLPVMENKVGLIRIFRHPVRNWTYEIPRGFVESGEGLVTGAARELKEETGVTCDSGNIHSLGTIFPDAGILHARIALFAATECTRGKPALDRELGHGALEWFSNETLLSMDRAGEMEDTITLTAWYRFQLWQSENDFA